MALVSTNNSSFLSITIGRAPTGYTRDIHSGSIAVSIITLQAGHNVHNVTPRLLIIVEKAQFVKKAQCTFIVQRMDHVGRSLSFTYWQLSIL